DSSGNYDYRYGDYVRMPWGYRELPLASFSLFWHFWSDWTCLISGIIAPPPTQQPSSSGSNPPPIPVIVPTPAPAYPPGVYVTLIHPVPSAPSRNQGVPFAITFVNTTGSTQNQNVVVQIFNGDNGKGFGETQVAGVSLPPGTTQFTSPDNWGVHGPGGCISLFAQAFYQNGDNS